VPVDESLIESAPGEPGVYLFKDGRGRVLYVGKAKNLRIRLRAYLRPEADGRDRIPMMIRDAEELEFIVTSSENEALLLENNLIKKHRPPYNVYFRDDKDYLCVRIDLSKEFPRFELVRKVRNDGARYFGPYSSARKIRQLVNLAGKLFPMRTCTDASFKKRKNPCMQYQIKRCLAPCVGKVDREEYFRIVQSALKFMAGNFREVRRELERRMKECSRALRFEEAASFRDRIALLDAMAEKQAVVNASLPDADVFGFYREGERGSVSILFLRGGRVIDVRSFSVYVGGASDGEFASSVLSQYYGEGAYLPEEVILPPSFESITSNGVEIILERNVKLSFPARGKKRELLLLAEKNAMEYFRARRKRELEYDELSSLMALRLKLRCQPYRIECFDVSHHGGKSAVGSMVVFEGGLPDRKSYRKFKIRTVEGIDDYAMLAEVVSRRLERGEEFGPYPDMLLLDGGRGHLACVLRVLSERGFKLDVVAIAKQRDRGTGGDDRIYLPGRKNPLLLAPSDPVLLFLKKVRDEAHRFAISFQRRLDERETLTSLLSGFPGIGKKRIEEVFTSYGSIETLLKADPSDVASKLRIPVTRVLDLKDYLRAHFDSPPDNGGE